MQQGVQQPLSMLRSFREPGLAICFKNPKCETSDEAKYVICSFIVLAESEAATKYARINVSISFESMSFINPVKARFLQPNHSRGTIMRSRNPAKEENAKDGTSNHLAAFLALGRGEVACEDVHREAATRREWSGPEVRSPHLQSASLPGVNFEYEFDGRFVCFIVHDETGL